MRKPLTKKQTDPLPQIEGGIADAFLEAASLIDPDFVGASERILAQLVRKVSLHVNMSPVSLLERIAHVLDVPVATVTLQRVPVDRNDPLSRIEACLLTIKDQLDALNHRISIREIQSDQISELEIQARGAMNDLLHQKKPRRASPLHSRTGIG